MNQDFRTGGGGTFLLGTFANGTFLALFGKIWSFNDAGSSKPCSAWWVTV